VYNIKLDRGSCLWDGCDSLSVMQSESRRAEHYTKENCGLFSFQPHLFNISSRQGITAHEMNHSVFEKRLMEPAWGVQKFPPKKSRLFQV